ncbi:hypothetical protein [Pseudomonas frederiksbergensis]|uniref:hypothetical protein n=1 Tax=Pseudomonas frederiksbergensis TaxID=104087 RepID=UPI0011CE97C6|nr:hypothetical protein [Pseudomonas frederiksbergensis]
MKLRIAPISIAMQNGSVANLSVPLGAAEELSRLRFVFSDMTVESRSTHPYKPGEDFWYFKGKSSEIDQAIATALEDFIPGEEWFAGEFALVYASLTKNRPTPVTLDVARQSLELITAIYHSAETGTVVTLPILSSHPKYLDLMPSSKAF